MPHKITRKVDLNSGDYYVEVEAPLVAEKFKAGNFAVLMTVPHGERIPMSIMKAEDGRIGMYIKKLGKTSYELDKSLDTFEHVIGPMGNAIEVKKYGRVVVASDLVCGHAENYAACKALREVEGNHVISIESFPTKGEVYPDEFLAEDVADEFHLMTEDGSLGEKGHYLDRIAGMLKEGKVDKIFAGGDLPKLKELGELTRPYGVSAVVTVRQIMVDASGMCGACRVFLNGAMKLACIDGPMFEADEVDWETALRRVGMFKEKETIAMEFCRKEGRC